MRICRSCLFVAAAGVMSIGSSLKADWFVNTYKDHNGGAVFTLAQAGANVGAPLNKIGSRRYLTFYREAQTHTRNYPNGRKASRLGALHTDFFLLTRAG